MKVYILGETRTAGVGLQGSCGTWNGDPLRRLLLMQTQKQRRSFAQRWPLPRQDHKKKPNPQWNKSFPRAHLLRPLLLLLLLRLLLVPLLLLCRVFAGPCLGDGDRCPRGLPGLTLVGGRLRWRTIWRLFEERRRMGLLPG